MRLCERCWADLLLLSVGGGLDGESLWRLVWSVLLLVAMMAGTLLLMRVLSKRAGFQKSRYIRVLDRFYLHRDACILLVEMAGRVMALYSGKEGGSLLCELTEEQVAAMGLTNETQVTLKAEDQKTTKKAAKGGFWGRFWHNFRVNMGLLPKGTPLRTPATDREANASATQEAAREKEAFSQVFARIQQAEAQEQTAARSQASPAASPGTAVPGAAQEAPLAAPPAPFAESGESAARLQYKAALAAMKRNADVEPPDPEQAPAAVLAQYSRTGSQAMDEQTARELLAALAQQRAGRAAAPTQAEGNEDAAYDDLMDKIAQRSSRYAARTKDEEGRA